MHYIQNNENKLKSFLFWWRYCNLLQEVDKENENQEDTEFGVDIDDELQNELCRLWDMAMNPVSYYIFKRPNRIF